MKDEKKEEVVDTSTKEAPPKTDGAAKETPTSTAPKEDKPVKDETQKPPESTPDTTEKAPSGETTPGESETEPDELLERVNEILGELYDGQSVESIQDELRPLMGDFMNASLAMKALSESPIWGPVLNDLMDQAEDGQTPNPDLAFVRSAPKEYVDRLYEGSDDEAVLKASEEYKSGVKSKEESEAAISSNLDQSIKEAEEFSQERGYSDEEKAAFMEQVKMWYKVFADGKITKDEYSLIEKGMNYDKDVADLQGQIPEEPKKEVLPDKSSIDAAKAPAQTKRKPGGMESIVIQTPEYLNTGSRKRKPV